jgi:hypothetical protein
MKKMLFIYAFSLLVMPEIISCEKEEDERDKFAGTWTGTLYFDRIATEYSPTVTITKSTTNSMQILIGQNTATIYGNSYTYEPFTSHIGIAGNYTGTGTINGDELTESGLITSDGALYEGNLGGWHRHLLRNNQEVTPWKPMRPFRFFA